jgi:hypothetical protein
MRNLLLAALLALAACHPSVPSAGDPDAAMPGDDDAAPPDAAPDAAPIQAPGTAMETVSAAGHVTTGAYALDLQLGGMTRGAAVTGTTTLDTVPVLH